MLFCPNKSAAGVICNKPLVPKQHHCYGCRYGGGVDRRHATLARADFIQSHSGVKVFVEQEVPALTRTERARMDLVFDLHGSITYLDVSIVAPFSSNPSLVAAASTKPGLVTKRAEKSKFDRYPHINLVPFILETTGRLGSHAKKFINCLLRDADNPPIDVRDTWSTIQSVLHSVISKQQLMAAVTCLLGSTLSPSCQLRLRVPATRFCTQPFSVSSGAMWPCCDFTSSDDDEHNTDSNFLLLFADIGIMPNLLDGLNDVCRFALEILTISQHFPSALALDPLPDTNHLVHESIHVASQNTKTKKT